MKRILLVGLVALGLAATMRPAKANFMLDYSVCRHFCFVHTQKNRCFNYSSCATPLPCAPGGGYAGPALWDGFHGYGPPPPYGYPRPAPVVAAPAAAPAPSFKAPQPSPAPKSTTGVQQASYFYYGPTNNAGYGSTPGYNYGTGYGYGYYGYGASYAQAPNYWY